MDVLYCCVWLLPLVAFSFGSEPPLKVSFENATSVVATEGDKVYLDCHLNRGALFILQNQVEIVHVNPRTQKEAILSKAGDLVNGDPAYYSITIQQNTNDRALSTVQFMIKQVRHQDDGTFLCRVRSRTGEVEASTEKEILVLRHLSSLKLQLGDLDPIEKTPATPVKINPGSYKVTCIAEGTVDVKLHLNGKTLITRGAAVVTKMDGSERQFKTEIHTNLNVEPRNDGQDLFCEAKDPTGMVKRVSVELNVDTMTITTTRPTKNIITTTRRMKTTVVTTTSPSNSTSTDAGSGDGARLSPGSPLLCVMFTVVVAALWSLH